MVLHELDDTDTVIACFDFDYRQKQLFFSTYHELFHKNLSTGRVRKIYPAANRTTYDSFKMVQLSFDWLNGQLYFLADFNSRKTYEINRLADWRASAPDQELIFQTNFSRIEHFQVDPYNGYIFWTDAAGMNRAVLGSNASNLVEHVVIYGGSGGFLGSFAIDYVAFRLFVIHNLDDHLISFTLNGDNVEMLRLDVTTATYTRAPSLVWLNNRMYWSDNFALVEERYNNRTASYEHSRFEIKCSTCVTSFNYVLGFSSLRQPIPYAQKAPANFTVLRGSVTRSSITVVWSKPESINDSKSKAAWDQYLYKIEYTNLNDSWTYEKTAIGELCTRLDGLQENCLYEIELTADVSHPISIGIDDQMGPERSRWSKKLWVRTKSRAEEANALATAATAAVRLEPKQAVNSLFADDVSLRPRKIVAEQLLPGEIRLKWLPSLRAKQERVWYEIYWRRGWEGVEDEEVEEVEEAQSKSDYSFGFDRDFYVSDLSLRPNETYMVWIRAHGFNKKIVSDSNRVRIRTLAEPHLLQLVNRTAVRLELEWKPSREILDYTLEWYRAETWTPVVPINTTRNSSFSSSTSLAPVRFRVDGLRPDTKHQFRLQLKYANASMVWPPASATPFVFETQPGPPIQLAQNPLVLRTGNRSYSIRWQASEPDTGPNARLQRVRYYLVECWDASVYTPFRSIICCNTTQAQCDITANVSQTEPLGRSKLIFRVAAVNGFGRGQFTNFTKADWYANSIDADADGDGDGHNGTKDRRKERSEVVGVVKKDDGNDAYSIVVGSGGSSGGNGGPAASTDRISEIAFLWLYFFFGILIVIMCVATVCKSRSSSNKEPQLVAPDRDCGGCGSCGSGRQLLQSSMEHSGANQVFDVNEERLVFASRTKFYELLPSPRSQDIRQLTHFAMEDFELIKLMGQGAFGDVYIGRTTADNRNIAVKTLRSNHDRNEREKFLKEAILMSNFRHKNVLKFLGICVQNADKSFILMELMENGDLLTFLRDSRCTHDYKHWLWTYGTKLTIAELLTMSIQVAMGCEYLARKQYVHRDLACRNCLIAIRDGQMLVKIGDFGLSRPIQMKNYYRIQSETLLPVRWMAPESLIDYRFSSASDVWSFGIVLWEIFSLGQEPYALQTQTEAVAYVRVGNVLNAPANCPSTVYDLMTKCWRFNPEDRITFKQSVVELRRYQKLLAEVRYANVRDGTLRNEYMDILPTAGTQAPAIGSNGGEKASAPSPPLSLSTAIVDEDDGQDETAIISIDNQAYVLNTQPPLQILCGKPSPTLSACASTLPAISEEDLTKTDCTSSPYTQTDL